MRFRAGRKRVFSNDRIEYGIVEKLSIQGDYLYAIVRHEGIVYANEALEIRNTETDLFGSNGTPEHLLLLADVLIPTDILPGMITMDYKFFIGKKVEVVVTENKEPRIVLLSRAASFIPSRGVQTSDLSLIRSVAGTREITNAGKKELRNLGYTSEEIDAILSEKYVDISTDEDILMYGNEESWHIDQQKDPKNNNYKNMKKISNFTFVSGLTGKQQRTKSCYLPILSIGGKV